MSDCIVTQAPSSVPVDLEKKVDNARDYCDSIWGLIRECKDQSEKIRLEAIYDQALSDWIHARRDLKLGVAHT